LVFNPKTTSFSDYVRDAKAMASSLGVELIPGPIESADDIRRTVESFSQLPGCGLVIPPDATTIVHRNLIVELANEHRLPAVFAFRLFVAAGGLMSYGIDFVDVFRQAASYVDRILHGAKPADLPAQAPTKYETIVNLKTAKALGLAVPPTLLVRADEVIE
jgi:putative ABC transport system substrate-binding protein